MRFKVWLEDRYQAIATLTQAAHVASAALRRIQMEGSGLEELINALKTAVAACGGEDEGIRNASMKVGDILRRTLADVKNKRRVPGTPNDRQLLPELEQLWSDYEGKMRYSFTSHI